MERREKDHGNAFSPFAAKRPGPPAPGTTRRAARRAVPVATQEATGIDSKARGSPFPRTGDESC